MRSSDELLSMLAATASVDSGYTSFAARMIAAEAAEIADIAKINAYQATQYQGAADTTAATIAPRKSA